MILYELFRKVRFEDLIPVLNEFCVSDRQSAGRLAYYKQAFAAHLSMKEFRKMNILEKEEAGEPFQADASASARKTGWYSHTPPVLSRR